MCPPYTVIAILSYNCRSVTKAYIAIESKYIFIVCYINPLKCHF